MIHAYSYNPNRFTDINSQDVHRWLSLYSIINYNVTFIDRTNTVQIPIRTKVPVQLQMPLYDSSFRLSYEECCQARVRNILEKQDKFNVPIKLLYSGGIDSSLILVSFIKEIGLAETEKRVSLVMSTDGIEENPWMWERIIRRSNFKIINSETHDGDWSKDRILVGGEFNDQLMGSDIYKDLVRWQGDKILDTKWTPALIIQYLIPKVGPSYAEMWFYLMEKIIKTAPIPIVTIAQWWQWINFTCKWSSVYFRLISCARNNSVIDEQYLNNYYFQFYGDTNFKQWSMNDSTDKIKGSWHTYKWKARQLVSDICGQEYEQKMKRGSLWRLIGFKKSAEVIDENYNLIPKINSSDWYKPDNSFKNFAK